VHAGVADEPSPRVDRDVTQLNCLFRRGQGHNSVLILNYTDRDGAHRFCTSKSTRGFSD
jgi:hypothetical protein